MNLSSFGRESSIDNASGERPQSKVRRYCVYELENSYSHSTSLNIELKYDITSNEFLIMKITNEMIERESRTMRYSF